MPLRFHERGRSLGDVQGASQDDERRAQTVRTVLLAPDKCSYFPVVLGVSRVCALKWR